MPLFADFLLLINIYELILARTEAYFLGLFEDMDTMTGVDTFDECRGIISFLRRVVKDQIDTCLIECNGVKRRQDTKVVHLGCCRMAVAVTIDGEVIRYIDVQDALSVAEIVMYG